MKKYFLSLFFSAFFGFFIFHLISIAEAKRLWLVDGLLGDGTSGTSRYLDMIHSGNSNLANNNYAIYFNSATSEYYFWIYTSNVTGSNNTSSHPMTVVPYDDPATGLWTEMQFGYLGDGLSGGSIYLVNINNPSLNADSTGVTVAQKQDTLPLKLILEGSSAGTAGVVILDDSGNTLFTIAQDGKVGIGTLGPDTVLHLSSPDGILKYQDSNTDGVWAQPRMEFYDIDSRIGWIGDGSAADNTVDLWSSTADGIIRIATGGQTPSNERIRITADGLIGIQTTTPNPNCKIDIQGLGSFTSGVSIQSGKTIYMGSNAGIFTNSGGSVYIFDAHGNSIDVGDLKN